MTYIPADSPDLHITRRKEMMRKYPDEMRSLMGPYAGTAFWIAVCLASHFTVAYFIQDQPIWVLLLAAYVIGAFLSHALYVFIHEAAHNLIFKSSWANRLAGIVCDWALLVPGAMAFRKYHLLHHTRMGQMDFDADLVSVREAKLVSNCPVRKTLWMLFLGISQAFRPMRIGKTQFWDIWIFINLLSQIAVTWTAVHFLGWTAILYLLASNVFGLGLHPLGGRWIAEHFVTHPGQETYSYYGPLNRFAFNVGYHTEHHDLMTVPWVRLPKIREIASEFYRDLPSYRSYTRLIVRFISDPKLSLFSRITRPSE